MKFETKFERQDRDKMRHSSNRRIVGYTLNKSVTEIKQQLMRILNHSKPKDQQQKLPVARPRANSQEDILQLATGEDSKSNIESNILLPSRSAASREPLSQFVTH